MPKVPSEPESKPEPAPTPPGIMPFEEYVFLSMIALQGAEGSIGFTPSAIPDKASVVGLSYAAGLQLLGDDEGAAKIRARVGETRDRIIEGAKIIRGGGYNEKIVHAAVPLTTDPPPKPDGEIERAFVPPAADITSDPYYSDLREEGKSHEVAARMVEEGRKVLTP